MGTNLRSFLEKEFTVPAVGALLEADRYRPDQERSVAVSRIIRALSGFFDQSADGASDWQIPQRVIQYWHEPPPHQVRDLISRWAAVPPFKEHILFNDATARAFVADHYGLKYLTAFDYCHHPALRSDLFRVLYLGAMGGVYIDADECPEGDMTDAFGGRSLWLAPRVWDYVMKKERQATEALANNAGIERAIYYLNNAPLAAVPNHPVIRQAIHYGVEALLRAKARGEKPNIPDVVGPPVITALVTMYMVRLGLEAACKEIGLITNWYGKRVSERWLDYKLGPGNWRGA